MFCVALIILILVKRLLSQLKYMKLYYIMFCSAQRLNDLGDESRLLPLWRQVFIYFFLCHKHDSIRDIYLSFENGVDTMVESSRAEYTLFSILFICDMV